MKQLYFGDNIDVLKKLYKENPQGFIDLIYIDPPFNSKQDYNILFENIDLKDTKAQKMAFADTWSNVSYHDTLLEIQQLDIDLFRFLNALQDIRLSKGAISYLTIMALRIWYMNKLLKDTGVFFLHCDPTMSHYLKIICDLIFRFENFQNEIIWQRINAKGNVQKKFGAVHDVIFRYSKNPDKVNWCQQYRTLDSDYVSKMYRYIEPETNRRYRLSDLTAPRSRASKGQIYTWKNAKLPATRCWVYARDKMEELDRIGRIVYSKNGMPNYKRYLDENKGERIPDIWTDIPQISGNEFWDFQHKNH